LPPGWTGKTNALATGVREAKGDWLLFIDSDTRHHPDNLSILMEYARRERTDMVSLLPRMRNGSFWERVVQPLAGMLVMLNYPIGRVNDDSDPDTAFANGQYILVRRKVYEAIGGHAAVRDKFVEDIHLAHLTKARRHRIRVVMAHDLSSTRMYTSLGSIVRGWSRIFYAAYNHSIAQLSGLLTSLLVCSLSAFGVFAGALAQSWHAGGNPYLSTLLGMSLLHLGLQASVMVRAYALSGNQRRYVAFYVMASLVMFWVLISALFKCFTHRIVWRGTCYNHLEQSLPVILPLPTKVFAATSEHPLKRSA
jgi:cellulose synthase/poly-beta-1,6-N-acetylglucosamine synthase-like glycosyltransferase